MNRGGQYWPRGEPLGRPRYEGRSGCDRPAELGAVIETRWSRRSWGREGRNGHGDHDGRGGVRRERRGRGAPVLRGEPRHGPARWRTRVRETGLRTATGEDGAATEGPAGIRERWGTFHRVPALGHCSPRTTGRPHRTWGVRGRPTRGMARRGPRRTPAPAQRRARRIWVRAGVAKQGAEHWGGPE